jgi:hypothetical protein
MEVIGGFGYAYDRRYRFVASFAPAIRKDD